CAGTARARNGTPNGRRSVRSVRARFSDSLLVRPACVVPWYHLATFLPYGEKMALNIKDPEVEKLAAEIAAMTGESKTRAVKVALQERRQRLALKVVHRD